MTSPKFYITAAIPYVNAAPHIGHALEFVQTDVFGRYHRLLGEDVTALSGGDENALKNVQAAEKAGVPIQEFVDRNTELFRKLTEDLNCQFDLWQKGSDKKRHYPSVQKLWKLCEKDIYKQKYEGLYCVGCEAFYSPEELTETQECYEHPGQPLEKITEENYFFRLSKYQDKLIELIEKDEYKIVPETRKNEVLSFLRSGLHNISISRSNERAKNWGVPVPNDPTQRIYVWFDALNIYQTGVGFGWDEERYNKWWPADVHAIGKGIIRFHAVYWPAFLLSAGLKLPKTLFVHGYFTVNGQKMSKTVGNVVDPFYLAEKYGAEALRYFLLAKFNPFTDGDFSEDRLVDTYNGELANGLGNLVARAAKLCEGLSFPPLAPSEVEGSPKFSPNLNLLEEFRPDLCLGNIWKEIAKQDKHLDETKPWALEGEERQKALNPVVKSIRQIAYDLQPFLPETAEKIKEQFKNSSITPTAPLFPRL